MTPRTHHSYPPMRRPGRRWSATGGKSSPPRSSALLDVASERRRGAAVALQEQHSRPGLVGDVSPDLDHHTPARARRDGPGWRRRRSVMAVQPPGLCEAA